MQNPTPTDAVHQRGASAAARGAGGRIQRTTTSRRAAGVIMFAFVALLWFAFAPTSDNHPPEPPEARISGNVADQDRQRTTERSRKLFDKPTARVSPPPAPVEDEARPSSRTERDTAPKQPSAPVGATPAPPTLVPMDQMRAVQQHDAVEGDVAEGDGEANVAAPSRIPNRRWVYSPLPAPLPSYQAAPLKEWKSAAPGFEHLVIRDEACSRALKRFFPTVPSNRDDVTLGTREVVCGLVAIWHDGGYFMESTVLPGRRSVNEWLVNHTGPSRLVVLRGAMPEWPEPTLFGSERHNLCVATAIENIGHELRESGTGSINVTRSISSQSRTVPEIDLSVLRALLSDDCQDGRFDFGRDLFEDEGNALVLPEHAGSGVENVAVSLFLLDDDAGLLRQMTIQQPPEDIQENAAPFERLQVNLPDIPMPARRWFTEEGALPLIHDARSCAAILPAMGEADSTKPEEMQQFVASLPSHARHLLCRVAAVVQSPAVAIGPRVQWLRRSTRWIARDGDTPVTLLAIEGSHGKLRPDVIASYGPSSDCGETVLRSIVDVYDAKRPPSAERWIDMVEDAIRSCALVLPASDASGDVVLAGANVSVAF